MLELKISYEYFESHLQRLQIKINIGAKIKTNKVKTNNELIKMPAREFKNSYVSFLLLAFSKSLYIGINAWLNAPSAKNLLNKFGIFKQITKIS